MLDVNVTLILLDFGLSAGSMAINLDGAKRSWVVEGERSVWSHSGTQSGNSGPGAAWVRVLGVPAKPVAEQKSR